MSRPLSDLKEENESNEEGKGARDRYTIFFPFEYSFYFLCEVK